MIALICNGCCCGTEAKHPGIDHDAHRRALAAATPTAGSTACLGPCRRSNVIVAVDETTGDQHWFTKVLADDDVAAVAAWIASPHDVERPDQLVRTPTDPTATTLRRWRPGSGVTIKTGSRRRGGFAGWGRDHRVIEPMACACVSWR